VQTGFEGSVFRRIGFSARFDACDDLREIGQAIAVTHPSSFISRNDDGDIP
jgi:hypothetical protein